MDVIFYLSNFDKKQMLFEKQVISLIPGNHRIICNSLNELSSVLTRTLEGQRICVVVAGKKQDLLDLISIRELLRKSKLILLLPDTSRELVEIAHTLYPRYLDSIRSSFSNIGSVLSKMLDNRSIDPSVEYHKAIQA
ncbi:hypothetical protein KJ966_29015 [bacterium]|nr:hypothetical protein [bacterium]